MPKLKKSDPIIQSLEELVATHDRADLVRALATLQGDLSWKILRAALMKEYLAKVVNSLDYSSKTGKQIEAAYESGVAQALFDTANSLIEKYKDVLERKTLVHEEVRPEE